MILIDKGESTLDFCVHKELMETRHHNQTNAPGTPRGTTQNTDGCKRNMSCDWVSDILEFWVGDPTASLFFRFVLHKSALCLLSHY